MQKVKTIKAHLKYKVGDIYYLTENEAHRLIEEEKVKLWNYPDKMMRPETKKKKGIKTKWLL